MPQGLEIFDENGNTTLAVNEGIVKILGQEPLMTMNGTIKDERIRPDGTWFLYQLPNNTFTDRTPTPNITIREGAMDWVFEASGTVAKLGGILYWGIY